MLIKTFTSVPWNLPLGDIETFSLEMYLYEKLWKARQKTQRRRLFNFQAVSILQKVLTVKKYDEIIHH